MTELSSIRELHYKVIHQEEHRYETVGDYWYPKGEDGHLMEVRVSRMDNADYEFLVFIHELIEAHLCRKREIKEEAISAFDIAFEKLRPEGNEDEPGDSPDAPYQKEHLFATKIERQLSDELGVDWDTYGTKVMSL
jgi:hypothetical protein